MEHFKAKYRQCNIFFISVEKNISLGRKSVAETLVPFSHCSLPPSLPLLSKLGRKAWAWGSTFSQMRMASPPHTCMMSHRPDKRPVVGPLHPGWVAQCRSERKMLVVAESHTVPTQLSWYKLAFGSWVHFRCCFSQ